MDEFERMENEKRLIRRLREKYDGRAKPGVSILLPTSKFKFIDNLVDNLSRIQYPLKELILIINNSQISPKFYVDRLKGFEDVSVYQLNEKYTLGDCLNFGIEKAKYDVVAKMDDDDFYGAHFLSDLIMVFQYTDAEITGKGVQFVYFEKNEALGIRLPIAKDYTPEEGVGYENRYSQGPCLSGGTLVIKKDVFSKVVFRSVNLGEDVFFLEDCTARKIPIYAADRYNYIYMRHENKVDHTWNVTSEYVYKQSHILQFTRDYAPIVVV